MLDDEISVAAVWPNGDVVVFGPRHEGYKFRERQRQLGFSNYGQAALWAAEFEEAERRDLAIRQALKQRRGSK
jgi:hypothetical protein